MNKEGWLYNLIDFLNLTDEQEDPAFIHESIEQGIVFKGTNLWILIFAILVASVGLNMNSTAVVIGAMLISPLMGPINGVGYSVATYNYKLFRKSLTNFAFAVSAALVTSTLYFMLTPIHTEHSELLSRTSPTIYDVLIASFGGFAGIVAVISRNKGNVIPGVAIATALMPPLCTAGYGISIANWSYFLGAMYLFVINSVFIALAAMVVSQLLNFPKQTHLLSREIKNKNIAIIVVTLLTVVPSIYLGLTLVRKEKFTNHAEEFVQKVSIWEGNYLLSNTIDADTKTIKLIYGGNEFDENSEQRLKDKAADLNLADANIEVEQGLKINDYTQLANKETELQKATSELNTLKATILMKEGVIDSLKKIPSNGEQLLKEIRPLFPEIYGCSYSVSQRFIDSLEVSKPVHLVIFDSDSSYIDEDRFKIHKWLKNRLNSEDIILRF
jgi:uncharacterized hydrophobic protein (TIGR00271 family)